MLTRWVVWSGNRHRTGRHAHRTISPDRNMERETRGRQSYRYLEVESAKQRRLQHVFADCAVAAAVSSVR